MKNEEFLRNGVFSLNLGRSALASQMLKKQNMRLEILTNSVGIFLRFLRVKHISFKS